MKCKYDPADAKCIEARRLRGLGWTLDKIGGHLGKSHTWVSDMCQDMPENGDVGDSRKETGDQLTVSVTTDRPIKTLEDACAVASVDLKVWYVDTWECTQWTVGMKKKTKGEDDQVVQTQQYRVQVRLKRLMKRSVQEALKQVFEEMKKYAPKYKVPLKEQEGAETLAVMCLFDAHFGKLAWAPEVVGEDYDLKIAEQVFRNAVVDSMARVKGRKIDRYVLPIGNDFFHIDNKQNTTFLGTPQDTDSRYIKIFKAGKMAVIWAVEEMIQYAPVDVIWVPGNHDPTMSYHLAETLDSWFHTTKRVTVDVTPPQRKYYMWNDTLLGFTHGDKIKPESLPNLMAVEHPNKWARAKCREWLIGHRHRAQKWVSKETDTHEGTTVRTIQALTATDAWHYEQGFVGAHRAAEVLLYEKNYGYVGNLIAQVRQ